MTREGGEQLMGKTVLLNAALRRLDALFCSTIFPERG